MYNVHRCHCRPKKSPSQPDKETYLRYAKSRLSLSGRELSNNSTPRGDSEGDKPGKTSLDCATIALKVLKTSMRQQVRLREKHSLQDTTTTTTSPGLGGEESLPGRGLTMTGGERETRSDCSERLGRYLMIKHCPLWCPLWCPVLSHSVSQSGSEVWWSGGLRLLY